MARRVGGGGPEVVVDRRNEALLHVSDLAGQGIGHIPLALPGEGCRAKTSLALSSCSPSGDEGSGESRVVTTGVEEGRRRLRRGREGMDAVRKKSGGIQTGTGEVSCREECGVGGWLGSNSSA
jgi:hypothetical protein